MATIIKRPGRASWIIQYFDASGRRREKSARTTDRRAAERLAARLEDTAQRVTSGLLSPREAARLDAAERPLAEHVQMYLDHCRHARQAPKNITEKSRHLARFSQETGARRLGDITQESLQANMASMMVTKRDGVDPVTKEPRWRRTEASARSRNFRRQALFAFASWCVKTGRLAENPLVGVARLDERNDRRRIRRPLTDAEFEKLIAVARSQDRYSAERSHSGTRGHRAAWYTAAALAGLRRGDLLRLLWEDVDFGASTLTVREGKAKRTDVLPLHPRLADELKAIRPHGSGAGRVFPAEVATRTRQRDFEQAGTGRPGACRGPSRLADDARDDAGA